eukprot:6195220-Pleurochrysis_carterae.AAC.1
MPSQYGNLRLTEAYELGTRARISTSTAMSFPGYTQESEALLLARAIEQLQGLAASKGAYMCKQLWDVAKSGTFGKTEKSKEKTNTAG